MTASRPPRQEGVEATLTKFHWWVNYYCIRELGLTNPPAVTATRHYELAGRLLSPLGPIPGIRLFSLSFGNQPEVAILLREDFVVPAGSFGHPHRKLAVQTC